VSRAIWLRAIGRLLFRHEGRIGRVTFLFCWSLLSAVLFVVNSGGLLSVTDEDSSMFWGLVAAILAYLFIYVWSLSALITKRYHDFGWRSPAREVLLFVVLLWAATKSVSPFSDIFAAVSLGGLVLLVLLAAAVPGNKVANHYGARRNLAEHMPKCTGDDAGRRRHTTAPR